MDWLFYLNLRSFLISISCFLIFCLCCFLIIIDRLVKKNKDYRNKKFFIISKKFFNILFFLHIGLTLINILISIFILRDFDYVLCSGFIGGGGIVIIYLISYILKGNDITILEQNLNKIANNIYQIIKTILGIIIPIILPIIIPICILIFVFYIVGNSIIKYIDLQYLQSLSEIINKINDKIGSEYTIAILLAIVILLVIAIILVAIFFLFFIFLVIMINSMIAIINQKLNIINKNIKNNKSAYSTKSETTKKDNKDNDYII